MQAGSLSNSIDSRDVWQFHWQLARLRSPDGVSSSRQFIVTHIDVTEPFHQVVMHKIPGLMRNNLIGCVIIHVQILPPVFRCSAWNVNNPTVVCKVICKIGDIWQTAIHKDNAAQCILNTGLFRCGQTLFLACLILLRRRDLPASTQETTLDPTFSPHSAFPALPCLRRPALSPPLPISVSPRSPFFTPCTGTGKALPFSVARYVWHAMHGKSRRDDRMARNRSRKPARPKGLRGSNPRPSA